MTPQERFWGKVAAVGECWEWKAYRDRDGYGMFSVSKTKRVRAHRFAYEAMVADIPDGLHLDHLCRNRACVNPDHLDPVPYWVNNRRGNTFQAANAAKTACPKGHPYDSVNRRRGVTVSRRCLTCHRERERERRERRYLGAIT